MRTQTVYTDDADAYVSWTITDELGSNLDWASPTIALGSNAYQSASWQGAAAATREIRLAVPSGLGLAVGVYQAYLKVPGGSDFALGQVRIADRS